MRAKQWLALIYALVVTQAGHFLEHNGSDGPDPRTPPHGGQTRSIWDPRHRMGSLRLERMGAAGGRRTSIPVSSEYMVMAHGRLQHVARPTFSRCI